MAEFSQKPCEGPKPALAWSQVFLDESTSTQRPLSKPLPDEQLRHSALDGPKHLPPQVGEHLQVTRMRLV
jgi:hypothetical protein